MHLNKQICVAILLISLFTIFSHIQSQRIENTQDGIQVYGSTSSKFSLEIFIDLMCDGSRFSFGNASAAIESMNLHKNPHFQMRMHIFALPYHHNAFIAAQGEKYIQDTFGNDVALQYVKLIFENQDYFFDENSSNMTEQEIFEGYAKLVSSNLSQVKYDDFLKALGDSKYNYEARASFEFGIARFVAATPSYFANGIPIDAAFALGQEDWVNFLSPFFTQKEDQKNSFVAKKVLE